VVEIICDMCGSEGRMYKAEIEGSDLTVCENCSKYGKIIKEVKEKVIVKPKKEIIMTEIGPKKEVISIVVEDFAERIKRKREKLSIKQEDFAKTINEKVSLIHHIETGKFTPSIELARKLEKALKIKLVAQHEETHEKTSSGSSGEFTIGDFIKINKK